MFLCQFPQCSWAIVVKKKRGIAEPKNGNGIVGALMLIKFFFNELSFLWNGYNI